MSEAVLTIGGIPILLAGGASVGVARGLRELSPYFTPVAKPEAFIGFDGEVRVPELRLLHTFPLADGWLECRFGVDADGVYYYDFPGQGALRFDARRPDRVACSAFANPHVLSYALWTAYAMLGLWRRALPVHASAVVCDGVGVLCLGESGTGKSTHTRLWLTHISGTHLLNDDSPILSAEGEGVAVWGSPWSGKTPVYLDESAPVVAMVRIEQRGENSIRRLAVVEAFAAVQPSCPPCLMKEDRLQDRLVEFVERVIGRVGIFRLGCRPDAAAAHLCHHTLFES